MFYFSLPWTMLQSHPKIKTAQRDFVNGFEIDRFWCNDADTHGWEVDFDQHWFSSTVTEILREERGQNRMQWRAT